MGRFVEVAVALPLRHTLHYALPKNWDPKNARDGTRVLAPVGRRGVSGVIVGTTDTVPAEFKLRKLSRVLDGPIVRPEILSLCRWVAAYYDAPLGEVLKAAAPPGGQAAGKEYVQLTELGRDALNSGALPRKTAVCLAGLMATGQVPQRQQKKIGLTDSLREKFIEKKWIEVSHAKVSEKLTQRTKRMVHRTVAISDELRKTMRRSPARLEILSALPTEPTPVTDFVKQWPTSPAHIRTLVKSELASISNAPVAFESQLKDEQGLSVAVKPPVLTPDQSQALANITAKVEEHSFHPFLLFGITGSGKTEVYLQAIANVLDKGRGAIVLVPEISLTPQLAARFRARFGEQVAVLHSGLRPRERFIEWHRIAEGKAKIAVGARSAIFAPVHSLGMIVVDEEHDSSFKQEEGVRYHARTVALIRAKAANAVCVFGSATPSIETFHAAETGAATKLELQGRATGQKLPSVEIVDLRQHHPDTDSFITAPLNDAIVATLEKKQQVILFLNRRGFQTFVLCTGCGDAVRCDDCSVSLTYHKDREHLACHYCGHTRKVPVSCRKCGSKRISKKGIGTERVFDALRTRFPDAKIGRLDRDTGRGGDIAALLGKVARGEIDILVGTQMVSKGHDFPNVTLVGALCADTGLSLPDFRASEKTFQLLTQVSGRSGRGDIPGKVLVQTYRPDAVSITCASKHDFEGFYKSECKAREELGYPPFGFLAAVRVDGPRPASVERLTRKIAVELKQHITRAGISEDGTGISVLGPSPAPLSRLRGKTRWHIWLRGDNRKAIRACVQFLRTLRPFTTPPDGNRTSIDIDPVSTL